MSQDLKNKILFKEKSWKYTIFFLLNELSIITFTIKNVNDILEALKFQYNSGHHILLLKSVEQLFCLFPSNQNSTFFIHINNIGYISIYISNIPLTSI